MILLITTPSVAFRCAAVLRKELGTRVLVAATAREAVAVLRQHLFEALVIDERLLDTQPSAVHASLRLAGDAVPVFVNPGLCSAERLAHETRAAMQRGSHERRVAHEFALRVLRTALKGDLTGILLSTQLALQTPQLLPDTELKLKSVCELAERMKKKLQA